MTKPETERLSVLETKVDDMKDDIADVKGDIKEIKNLLLGQNDKFITKKAIVTWITLASAVIIAAVAAANYFTHK